ncbi:uncharacterized protein LOC129221256 [Uloborus diversus]|uniref:uncharacterized protein LOC129221256 n=1 Tax=Uloborus diversus TaxID=327109 RepID=UPI002409CF04|nr:uncharacterized protein LOC129221256 [Uloborus diversus]
MALMKTFVYILCFTLLKIAASAPTEESLDPWAENAMTETTTESSTSTTPTNETVTEEMNSTTSNSTEIITTTIETSNSTEETFEADIIDETIPWEYEQETTVVVPTASPKPDKPSSASSAYLHCLAFVFACSVLSSEKLLFRL